MYAALIFAAVIAAFGFIAGAIGSIFASDVSLLGRLCMALGVAGATFVAALVLALRDYFRQSSARAEVQRMLLAREDLSKPPTTLGSTGRFTPARAETR